MIEGDDRKFEFIVNGQRIFCKGGNWIPNDFIYARVPDEKYHVLTDEAIEANFNMFRIWGGGLYEKDIFYIDVENVFDDANGNLSTNYSSDGIHLFPKDYNLWKEYLLTKTINVDPEPVAQATTDDTTISE